MAADDRLEDDLQEDELARRLREAHRRVRMLPSADKARLGRRYLAICDLAKRDRERAAARLDAFLAALDTPRSDENTCGD
ncbi:hypothetical protein FH608_020630 [Nonomuraea phyllanthi]|uniref:Uncharacterized protein n=1 Tax=Nonomuraea phyllanthi TaxID=2219224 RepID=A0A5C4WHC8_9ACTN|nr:hypothetical protein [Nonomuraea phyllanthi]KAB8193629.1 hypothetical protein FH608_020630 [Nonomuraea phyllanthi]QFY12370.1 hypothetical protein GBF35_42535 [Nonomuraea phyllanthi]